MLYWIIVLGATILSLFVSSKYKNKDNNDWGWLQGNGF